MTAPAPFRRFPVPARPGLAGLLALAALATGPAGAQALRYTLDPVHTRVLFSRRPSGCGWLRRWRSSGRCVPASTPTPGYLRPGASKTASTAYAAFP